MSALPATPPASVPPEQPKTAKNFAAPFREGPRYTVEWRTESVAIRCQLRMMVYLLQGRLKIEDRDSQEMIPLVNLRPGQRRMLRDPLIKQSLRRRPNRSICAKYRRVGVSTISTFKTWFKGVVWRNRYGVTIAHTDDAALDIFGLARSMHEQHPILSGTTPEENADWIRRCRRMGEGIIRHLHSGSVYTCASGIANFIKSGSTIHDLHFTELAKMMNTSKQDARACNSLINAMSQTREDTEVVLESSGQGSDGEFPKRCRAAQKEEGNYILIFIPWKEDETLMEDVDDLPDVLDPAPEGYEIVLQTTYGVSDAQLIWRRKKLADDFPGSTPFDNPPEFGWDYPITIEDLFSQKAGRIYLPFSRSRHVPQENDVAKFYPLPGLRYRFVDWNFSEATPATCLFVAVDKQSPPELIVFPCCENFISEHLNYAREKGGQPQREKNHTVDAFRIGVTALDLKCRVIVYREIYWFGCPSPTAFARRIHKQSGWYHPRGDNAADIRGFRPGPKGEIFKPGVADRAQPGMITDFRKWGIPLIPSQALRGPKRPTSKGEVEDGIDRVLVLMEGDSSYRLLGPSLHETILERAEKKLNHETGLGRRRTLNKQERRAIRREYPQVEEASDFIDGPSRTMRMIATSALKTPHSS